MEFEPLAGKRVGLVCNQASLGADYAHALPILEKASGEGKFKLTTVFGPQHGLWGHTQDNMIEWEGSGSEGPGLKVFSLYGELREPSREMLADIGVLVIDLPDVGARYYTFIWTMTLCLKACAENGVSVIVLDRPNPIGGSQVEGPIMSPAMDSFVGLYPAAARHGLTIGEVALWMQATQFPSVDLRIVAMQGWSRGMYWDQTGLPWAMPSPNMPTLDTAIVYPGMCLFEGTKLSEGRGTTRPFEIFGAPGIDGAALAQSLNNQGLPGVFFRPYEFEPTFQKHAKQTCGGCHIHVLDRKAFRPVVTAFQILRQIHEDFPTTLHWQDPPYEYVWDRRPIDLLTGDPETTSWITGTGTLSDFTEQLADSGSDFRISTQEYCLYE